MKSGVGSGSRWGLKGTEELGNGLTVGFILEDGFGSDTGSEDSTGVMFNRESSLFLQGNFGKIALGRMGALNSGQSSWSKVGMINASELHTATSPLKHRTSFRLQVNGTT